MRPGQILGGRYRVEDVLGAGGMATVVSARELRGGRRVALKLPHPHAADRLLREARTAQRLTGPHAVRLLESGELDGAPFLAYEYLDGVDLARFLDAHRSLAPGAAAAVIADACRGLAEAHARGLVHLDVKPSNLFVTSDRVVVIDFGIARDDAATTGTTLGTPAYMAPEQLRPHAPADPRGDVWSLGVVLYELLGGRRPFVADELPALCLSIMLDDPEPIDDAAWPIIARCLAKAPEDRFADAGALLEALAPHAVPRRFTPDELELEAHAPDDGRRRPRMRWRWLALASAAACAAGLLGRGTDAEVAISRPVPARAVTAIAQPVSTPPSPAPAPPHPVAPARAEARPRPRPRATAAAVAPALAPAPVVREVIDPLGSPF